MSIIMSDLNLISVFHSKYQFKNLEQQTKQNGMHDTKEVVLNTGGSVRYLNYCQKANEA